MKATLEIVELKNDVVTTSTGGCSDITPPECCDWGCYTDTFQTSPENHDD